MNPSIGGCRGGTEGLQQIVGDAHHDFDVGARESREDFGVGIEELDFGDVVGTQHLHDDSRRHRLGGEGAPVEAQAGGSRQRQKEDEKQAP